HVVPSPKIALRINKVAIAGPTQQPHNARRNQVTQNANPYPVLPPPPRGPFNPNHAHPPTPTTTNIHDNARSLQKSQKQCQCQQQTPRPGKTRQIPTPITPPALCSAIPKNAPPGQPFEYGPRTTPKEIEEQNTKQYPNMFPPQGTVMHKFLTSKWIHIWIAMSILFSLATFTFTTNFKATSPFAHLLPSWSELLTSPFGTISRAFSVWRMHVQHESMRVREQRHRRVEDAEKRKMYRVAHGLEEEDAKKEDGGAEKEVDVQSPVAVEVGEGEFVDWEGKKRPVKKWFGIW
ncbi:hypothetical protein N7485_000882, partial [Penicillium canescens]